MRMGWITAAVDPCGLGTNACFGVVLMVMNLWNSISSRLGSLVLCLFSILIYSRQGWRVVSRRVDWKIMSI